jgi:hypothetical protein
MAKITESTPQRMVLQSGSTTLSLDKATSKAILRRKMLFWSLKPAEASLADVTEVTIDTGVDRASGIEVCNTMLVIRGGTGWALSAADRKDAEVTAVAIRGFLGLAG